MQYYEWLIMTQNRDQEIPDEKLRDAFDYLQVDGKITVDGIKQVIGGDKYQVDEFTW